jgi:hypothetical protein
MSHKITSATWGRPGPPSPAQRMIDDMAFHNISPNTQKVYAYAVANFARYHQQSPDKLGLEHIRDYRLHLMSRGLKASSPYWRT